MCKLKKLLFILLSVMLLASFLAGCIPTENGDKEEGDGITPLTAKEMDFFNGDEFFNGSIVEMGGINICNQFLSSLYDTPEEIDLFELFYCGSGLEETVTEEERTAVIEYNEWDAEPDCACEKISCVNMDAVLTEYMGLTHADTKAVGLEKFTYLEEYDAYYYFHGDTNYRGSIAFSSGEREGNLIHLLYDDLYMADGNKILTLREQDGKYLFVSNQKVENSIFDANDKYNTEADFLNSVEGIEFQVVAYKAAKALLSADADELSKYMLDPDEATSSTQGISAIFDDVEYMILVWSLDSIKSDKEIRASYRFAVKGEDSVSYVTMELIKTDEVWKVRWLGFEK